MSRILPDMELPVVGRLRLGGPKTKNRPGEPLDYFRATAPIREDLDELARQYGDPETIEPWESPNGPEWQTVLTEAVLPIALPPYADTLTGPDFELFNAGHYLVRSCDGRRCWTPDKEAKRWVEGPCLCDPEEPECALVVRLKTVVLGIPVHGVWLLEAHSAYAGRHWPALMRMAQQLAQQGRPVRATIRIEARNGRSAIHGKSHYKVPVLRLEEPLTLPLLERQTEEPPGLPAPRETIPPDAEIEDDDAAMSEMSELASEMSELASDASAELAAEEPGWLDMTHQQALSTSVYVEFNQRLKALGATIGQYQRATGGSINQHSLRTILAWAASRADH